jgi:hypothetical protein
MSRSTWALVNGDRDIDEEAALELHTAFGLLRNPSLEKRPT